MICRSSLNARPVPTVVERAEEDRTCPECDGDGQTHRGSSSSPIACPTCRAAGFVKGRPASTFTKNVWKLPAHLELVVRPRGEGFPPGEPAPVEETLRICLACIPKIDGATLPELLVVALDRRHESGG